MQTVLAIVLFLVSGLNAQNIIHTNGSSGELCPRRKCLANRADCTNNVCVCRPPFQLHPNNGNFACYRSNQVYGEVRNDPTITNFNKETERFQYPCRYLLTSVATTLRIAKQNQGTCRCIAHSWNQKFRGKFFVGGFDFACYILNTILNQVLKFSVRIEGIANNGHYTYTEYSVNDFRPDGPWTTAPLSATGAGIHVETFYDAINNQARVAVNECGWVITFVAYDTQDRLRQDQIPGLSFAINCGLDPQFLEHDRVMATAPPRFGGTTYADLAQPPQTVEYALLVRAFTSNVTQNQPDASAFCPTVGTKLNRCDSQDEINDASKGCFWPLNEPRFIRCLDSGENVSPLLILIDACIDFYCNNGVSCNDLVNLFTNSGCGHVQGIPQLTYIVNRDIC